MKAISHKGTITSITAKVDGSVGYRINTPELSSDEKTAIFQLQNKNVDILVNPLDEQAESTVMVKKEMDTKTASQRMRAVIFLMWKNNNEGHEIFDVFYELKMNKLIEYLKGKLDD